MSDEAGAELVEVVDENGQVIDVVPRSEIRARTLRHRCTYVAVVTSARELIVHQRANWKDVYPSFWDICFGGIAGVGERWEESAARELVEEAGISGVDLHDLGPVTYDAPDGRVFGRAYLARHDGPITCPDGEVVQVDRIAVDQVVAWLSGRSVCPDSRNVVLPLVLGHFGIAVDSDQKPAESG